MPSTTIRRKKKSTKYSMGVRGNTVGFSPTILFMKKKKFTRLIYIRELGQTS